MWPALFLVLPVRHRLKVVLALFAFAPLWRAFNLHVLRPPSGAINLGRADLHFDTLAAGVILALARRGAPRASLYAWARSHGGMILAGGLVVVLALQLFVPKDWPLTMTVRDVAIAAIVLAAATNPGRLAQATLDFAPVRLLGRLSYSLYLWQQVFFYWWSVGDEWFGRFPANLVGAFLAAAASYWLIERPVLAWRDRQVVAAPSSFAV